MKIFIFGTRGFPNIQGGVEKHCEHLYPLLAKDFEIIVFRRKPYIIRQQTKSYNKVRFIDLPSSKIKGFEALFHSFLCCIYCIFQRPALIHIHNIGPGIFTPILKLFRLKVVLTYHSPNYEHNKWNKIEKFGLKISENLSVNYADHIIFVSKIQQNKFKEEIKNKSSFLPNGIEIYPRITEPSYITKLKLKPYKFILAVGRITQEKGFDYLIDAFLKVNHQDIKLVIAGDSDHNTEYETKIRNKSDNVIFTGYTTGKDLQELYSFARLFIIPSYNEGHPLVLLEAISYNLPILASDIPQNLQINLPFEQYFKTGDINNLAHKIETELKKETYIAKYDKTTFYSWKDIAQKTKDIYLKINPALKKS